MGGLDGRALRAGDRSAMRSRGKGRGAGGNRSPRAFPLPRPRPLAPSLPQAARGCASCPGASHICSRTRLAAISRLAAVRSHGLSAGGRPPIERVCAAGELISTAVATGAIQVPPTGQPILLMNDHADDRRIRDRRRRSSRPICHSPASLRLATGSSSSRARSRPRSRRCANGRRRLAQR